MRCVTQKSFYTVADRHDFRLAHQRDAKNGLDHGARSTSVNHARLRCLAELRIGTLAQMEKTSPVNIEHLARALCGPVFARQRWISRACY